MTTFGLWLALRMCRFEVMAPAAPCRSSSVWVASLVEIPSLQLLLGVTLHHNALLLEGELRDDADLIEC